MPYKTCHEKKKEEIAACKRVLLFAEPRYRRAYFFCLPNYPLFLAISLSPSSFIFFFTLHPRLPTGFIFAPSFSLLSPNVPKKVKKRNQKFPQT
jgi:hypothetical protein